jgi:hypothetical protein
VRYELAFYISEDGILHSRRAENIKSYLIFNRLGYVAVTYCVSCEVKLGFYISKDGILRSHRHEILKSYIVLTGWTL